MMHSIELCKYSPGTWWTKNLIIRLSRKSSTLASHLFVRGLACYDISNHLNQKYCKVPQKRMVSNKTLTFGWQTRFQLDRSRNQEDDVVPKAGDNPHHHLQNPEPIWRESPCSSNRRSQTLYKPLNHLGQEDKQGHGPISLSHEILKRTKTRQNATEHQTDAPDLTVSLATSIPASHIFLCEALPGGVRPTNSI